MTRPSLAIATWSAPASDIVTDARQAGKAIQPFCHRAGGNRRENPPHHRALPPEDAGCRAWSGKISRKARSNCATWNSLRRNTDRAAKNTLPGRSP